jgi:hypothetical protein
MGSHGLVKSSQPHAAHAHAQTCNVQSELEDAPDDHENSAQSARVPLKTSVELFNLVSERMRITIMNKFIDEERRRHGDQYNASPRPRLVLIPYTLLVAVCRLCPLCCCLIHAEKQRPPCDDSIVVPSSYKALVSQIGRRGGKSLTLKRNSTNANHLSFWRVVLDEAQTVRTRARRVSSPSWLCQPF